MNILIQTETDPTVALLDVEGKRKDRFNPLYLGNIIRLAVSAFDVDGTLPEYWGNAEYRVRFGVGSLETRTKYADTGNMEYANGKYTGLLDLTGADLEQIMTNRTEINLTAQILVTSFSGSNETIMHSNVQVRKAGIS
jgi:hypothetical protein